MAERKEPESQEPGSNLLNSCRRALRRDMDFRWWLLNHRPDLLKVLALARDRDSAMLSDLRRHAEVRTALATMVRFAWRNATNYPDPGAMDLTVEWAICGVPPELSMEFCRSFREVMRNCSNSDRAMCYEGLIDRLRPVFSPANAEVLDRSGWVYLLSDAGKAVLRDARPDAAVTLFEEAWACRAYLHPRIAETAKATAHLAIAYAAAVGRLRAATFPVDRTQIAFDHLTMARELLDEYGATLGVVQSRVRLGIAEARVWQTRRQADVVGIGTEAEHQVEVLVRAELDLWRGLGVADQDGTVRDLAALPAPLRPTVGDLLGRLAVAAWRFGDADRALRAAWDALALSDEPYRRWHARVTLARVQPRLGDRLRHNEALLRDAAALDRLDSWQRRRIAGRLRKENVELVRMLNQARRPLAAWFWTRQARSWRTTMAVRPAGRLRPPATASATAATWPEAIADRARREHVPQLMLDLVAIADSKERLPRRLRATCEADSWDPPGQRRDPHLLPAAHYHTAADIELAALQLAAEFADGYVDILSGQIYGLLASCTQLSWDRRREYAEQAFTAATCLGSWPDALDAKEMLLELAFEHNDPEFVGVCAGDIRTLVQSWFVPGAATTDHIDLTEALIGGSGRIVDRLAAHAHARFAFDIACATTEAIRGLVAANPDMAAELELVARCMSTDTRTDLDDELFELMGQRVAATSGSFIPPARNSARIAPHFLTDASIVQLVNTADGDSWALGLTRSATAETYWAEPLDMDARGLAAMRETVESQLRPSRQKLPVPILDDVYRSLVRPFSRHLSASGDIAFILDRDFAGIPLHAARDGREYLVQRHRVGYLLTANAERAGPVRRVSALIAGWDPGNQAEAEATELHSRLAGLGFKVSRPTTAELGRSALLKPGGDWGVVHVAAHGETLPWPASMHSRLVLFGDAEVTAAELLRFGGQSAFVFLNACSVGCDLNGFPLALHACGMGANISALSLVPSGLARDFARSFYLRWTGTDSLAAYQAACVDAINDGTPIQGWAPYLHTGTPVRLPCENVSRKSAATENPSIPMATPPLAEES